MSRKIIENLDSFEYEHEFDKKALSTLEKTPGLELLVRKFNEYWNDKIFKIQITGSYLKVTEDNFPDVHRALIEGCTILNIKKIPKLYIQWGYDVNAYTVGVEDPFIVLNSGCIDLLSYDELLYVIGHELGHIKSEHVLYLQMARVLPILGDLIGSATLGIGKLLSQGLKVAILHWARMAEFTADRAGLLVCQNMDATITTIMKIAGLPLTHSSEANFEVFKKQAKEFEEYDYDTLDKVAKLFCTVNLSHPWSVLRASEQYNWFESQQYVEIINRKGFSFEKYILICSNCGSKMRVPKGLGDIAVKCPSCKEKFEMKS